MNVRVTMGLAVVLVVLAGVYFALGPGEETTGASSPSQVAAPTLMSYTMDEISGVVVQVGGETITLRRAEGGEWTYGLGSSAPNTSADQSRISGLVGRLAGLKAQSRIADTPTAEQVAEYGLQQPHAEITVGKGSEGTTFQVGVQNARRTGYYVRRADGGAIDLVDAFLVDDLKRLLTSPPVPPTPTPTATATAQAAASGPTATPTP